MRRRFPHIEESALGDREDNLKSRKAAHRRRAIWLLVGAAAGAALLIPRRWISTNDVTTGRSAEYPDLAPRHYDRNPDEVFEMLRRAVRHMSRWKVVGEDVDARRVEAEARTFLFGFTDDVTAWVEPLERGCRVMVRSRSRIGRGDLGENARSIRALLRTIDEEIHAVDRPGKIGRPDPGVEIKTAAEGSGPLLQRDYTGVILGTDTTPEEIILMVRSDIERFSAPELARFIRPPSDRHPLRPGDDVEVQIAGTKETHVRVVHVDDRSFTFRTFGDHVEAGRITFASWPGDDGQPLFHIRSRARQAGPAFVVGFFLGGKGVQTRIWETFIERIAEAAGGRLAGGVQAETREVHENMADAAALDAPTIAVPSRA